MSGIVNGLIVLFALIGTYAFMFRGLPGRNGRPPSGVATRLPDPTDAHWAVAGMGAYALGSTVTVTDPNANSTSGLAIGLLAALVFLVPGVKGLATPIFGVLGLLVGALQMVLFVSSGDELTAVYRVTLMLLITVCFGASAVLFGRTRALSGTRGLALLGLVEIVSFLAFPANRSTLSLDGVSHTTYLFMACGLAVTLGWAASEYVLGVVTLAVLTTSYLANAVIGDADQAWVGFVAAVAAWGFLGAFKGVAGLLNV